MQRPTLVFLCLAFLVCQSFGQADQTQPDKTSTADTIRVLVALKGYPSGRAAGMSEIVSKTAAGAIEHIAVVKVVNIVNTLEELKQAGIWIAGAEADGE